MQFGRCIFINKAIFCHLKLDIALAIPASNDEKYKQTIQQDNGLRGY